MDSVTTSNQMVLSSRIPARTAPAETGEVRVWAPAVQVGLVVSILAAVVAIVVSSVVATVPLVLTVMVVGFIASWIATGRSAPLTRPG